MSTRERWIVYPLLFMTLGLAMRDKVYPPSKFWAGKVQAEEMDVKTVRCEQLEAASAVCGIAKAAGLEVRELSVNGPKGGHRVWLGVMQNQSGQMELYGKDGQPVLVMGAEKTGRSGFLQTLAGDRSLQVLLHSLDGWGMVSAIGPGRTAACTMGSDGESAGVFAEFPKENRVVPLTRLVPLPKPKPK
jgi:hypothetical protein